MIKESFEYSCRYQVSDLYWTWAKIKIKMKWEWFETQSFSPTNCDLFVRYLINQAIVEGSTCVFRSFWTANQAELCSVHWRNEETWSSQCCLLCLNDTGCVEADGWLCLQQLHRYKQITVGLICFYLLTQRWSNSESVSVSNLKFSVYSVEPLLNWISLLSYLDSISPLYFEKSLQNSGILRTSLVHEALQVFFCCI